MTIPSYREELISQIPAARLLVALGYQYLTPAQALATARRARAQRGARPACWKPGSKPTTASATVTRSPHLQRLGHRRSPAPPDRYQPQRRPGPHQRTASTTCSPWASPCRKPSTATRASYSLHYIDWQHPENNVYHVTEEFAVERERSPPDPPPRYRLLRQRHPLRRDRVQAPRPANRAKAACPTKKPSARCCATRRKAKSATCSPTPSCCWRVSTNHAAYATTGTRQEILGDLEGRRRRCRTKPARS